jgi:hypothetical protein
VTDEVEEHGEAIENLAATAVDSYGETREAAIRTLATFGEEAVPALAEVAREVDEHDELAMAEIRDINRED